MKEQLEISDDSAKKKRSVGDQCTHFNISLFVTSFSTLIKTSQSTVTITKPDKTIESVSLMGNSFTVYTVDSDPQKGQWKACVSSGTLTQSLSISVKIETQITYILQDFNNETLPTSKFPNKCEFGSTKLKIVILFI